jgi:sulfate permease, SulP family
MLKKLFSALEALSSAVPIGLGAIVWIGYKIGPEMIAPMIFALFCGIAITNCLSSFSKRPLLFSARFFEISLLVGFVDSFVPKLVGWGLVDSPAVRLTLVITVCIIAALFQPLFYGMRLQRLTRFIPAPVFAGFLNAIALILVISQIKQIIALVQHQPTLWVPSQLIATACFALAFVVKLRKPNLPAGILALAAASAIAFALGLMGNPMPNILSAKVQWTLPMALFDGQMFDATSPALSAIVLELAITGFLLAVVIFLNTNVAAEIISQVDDKPEPRMKDTLWISAGQVISACMGAVPMSGSPASTLAAMRSGGEITGTILRLFAVLVLLFYALGFMAWVPQSAMIGLLIFEASCMYDRSSSLGIWEFLTMPRARRAMSALQREDLLIVVLVTLMGVFANMVAALLAGMILGLVLFAKRNAKSPIKDVRTAQTLRSNCERSWQDTQWLDQQGARIQCVRLQGALYFGVARTLRAELNALLPHTQWLVIDWRAVVSQDTTLLRMFERFEQMAHKLGVQVVHCAHVDDKASYLDVDRAMEFCENQLIAARHEKKDKLSAQNTLQSSVFFDGLDSEAHRLMSDCFESRRYETGATIFKNGELLRDLHLITQGRADVVIADGTIRVASVCAGSILGEMGFLDGSPRAATVVATEAMSSQVLSRERFEALSMNRPDITQKVLQNLCAELAKRLRSIHTQLAREWQ